MGPAAAPVAARDGIAPAPDQEAVSLAGRPAESVTGPVDTAPPAAGTEPSAPLAAIATAPAASRRSRPSSCCPAPVAPAGGDRSPGAPRVARCRRPRRQPGDRRRARTGHDLLRHRRRPGGDRAPPGGGGHRQHAADHPDRLDGGDGAAPGERAPGGQHPGLPRPQRPQAHHRSPHHLAEPRPERRCSGADQGRLQRAAGPVDPEAGGERRGRSGHRDHPRRRHGRRRPPDLRLLGPDPPAGGRDRLLRHPEGPADPQRGRRHRRRRSGRGTV